MRLSVFTQTLEETRRSLLRWTIILAGAAWAVALVHPLILLISGGRAFDAGRFLGLALPGWLSALLMGAETGTDQLVNWPDWVGVIGLELLLPVLLVAYAIWQGSRLVAGEEERGSLGLLLAAPIPRYRVIIEKFGVLCLLVLGPALAVGLSLLLLSLLFGAFGSLGAMAASLLPLFLLGLVFGALAMALGSLSGRRLLSQRLVLALAVLAWLVSRLPDASLYQFVRFFSPFHYYHQALHTPLLSAYALALVGWAVAFFALAWLAFERRDLAV